MSQIVMTSNRPKSALPYAFTEQGVAMLSGLLKSDVAIAANIAIMRAFRLDKWRIMINFRALNPNLWKSITSSV